MAEKKKAFYECDLELVRVNKFTARYRVANQKGAPTDFNHIEFDRKMLPKDVDFNMDFINADLKPDPEYPELSEANAKKQVAFRKFMKLKLSIVKE